MLAQQRRNSVDSQLSRSHSKVTHTDYSRKQKLKNNLKGLLNEANNLLSAADQLKQEIIQNYKRTRPIQDCKRTKLNKTDTPDSRSESIQELVKDLVHDPKMTKYYLNHKQKQFEIKTFLENTNALLKGEEEPIMSKSMSEFVTDIPKLLSLSSQHTSSNNSFEDLNKDKVSKNSSLPLDNSSISRKSSIESVVNKTKTNKVHQRDSDISIISISSEENSDLNLNNKSTSPTSKGPLDKLRTWYKGLRTWYKGLSTGKKALLWSGVGLGLLGIGVGSFYLAAPGLALLGLAFAGKGLVWLGGTIAGGVTVGAKAVGQWFFGPKAYTAGGTPKWNRLLAWSGGVLATGLAAIGFKKLFSKAPQKVSGQQDKTKL